MFRSVPLFRRVPVFRCSGVPVFRCSGVPVFLVLVHAVNNGFSSPFFNLHRGVRQGCPLSGMLFILAVEILSCAIRSEKLIKGKQVKGKELKLTKYADDTKTFVKDGAHLGNFFGIA